MPMPIDPHKTFPREFVPEGTDFGRWEDIERLGEDLLSRRIDSAEALVQWLSDSNEIAAAVSEEDARRFIANSSQTDDPAREAAYLSFVKEIQPKWKALVDRLDRFYLASPYRAELPKRYAVFDRKVENRVAIFRAENTSLEAEEAEHAKDYRKTSGSLAVIFRGKEYTLNQMARFFEDPDRTVRQWAWDVLVNRRLQAKDALTGIFEKLFALRLQIARNAGFASYRDYAFRNRERFDYTPEDCVRYHEAVERHIVPVERRLMEERRALLGLESLRPWDTEVDPRNRPALKPFSSVDEFMEKAETVLRRVKPEFGDLFRFMRSRNLLDLENRKGKAPGAYHYGLDAERVSFIFLNAVGMHRDVRTILHESGHAMNFFSSREQPLVSYLHPPIEFAEVASMGMELLTLPHLDVFYPDREDFNRACRGILEESIGLLCWVATIDAFQHWLYTHPDHAPDERRAAWVELYDRFNPGVDWSGYGEMKAHRWLQQLHIFELPFYYIEYGIAQLGAIQLWLKSQEDYPATVGQYHEALRLGGSEPLPELFAAGGIRFAFDDATIAPLGAALAAGIEKFPL